MQILEASLKYETLNSVLAFITSPAVGPYVQSFGLYCLAAMLAHKKIASDFFDRY